MLCLLAPELAVLADMAAPTNWLTATEAARLRALGTEARRHSFLAGRWLARRAVQRWLGGETLPALDVATGGACAVIGVGSLHASISHSAGFVACVAADFPVGVDVESLDRPRDYLALAEALHGQAQREQLAGLDADARALRFLQWWTLKEAWLKARGQGLDFALMRRLAFEEETGGDTAVTRIGNLVLSVAAESVLPFRIEGPPDAAWRRFRTHRLD